VSGDLHVAVVGKQFFELDTQHSAFCQHAEALFDMIAEIFFISVVENDDRFTEEGTDLGTADIEDIAELCEFFDCQVVMAGSQTIAESCAVDKQRNVVFLTYGIEIRQFFLRIKRAAFRREGDIDNAGLDDMLMGSVIVMIDDILIDLGGADLAAAVGQIQAFMTGSFQSACFMDIDMTAVSAYSSLVMFQDGSNHGHIGLGAADHEMDIGIRTADPLSDQVPGILAMRVFHVADRLFLVGSVQSRKNLRDAAFSIVTVKTYHIQNLSVCYNIIYVDRRKMRRFAQDEIAEMAEILKNDGVISVPTDTVYGLCARMDSLAAQEHLRDIKHRPADKAFPVMCKDLQQIEEIAEVNPAARDIITRLMPGPLTVVLRKKPDVADYVNGGMETLAIRMATSDALARLIEAVGVPLFMTSANRSGEKTCTDLDEIERACPGLDGMMEGSTAFGKASTIADCTKEEVRILREGPLDLADLKGEN